MGGPGVSATIATSAGHTAEPHRGKAACDASHLQSQCLNSGRSGWPPCWHPGNPDPSHRGLDQRGSCYTAPGSPTPASEMMQNEGPSSSGGPQPPGVCTNPEAVPRPSPTLTHVQGVAGPIWNWRQSWSRPGPGSAVVILNGCTLPSSSVSARSDL